MKRRRLATGILAGSTSVMVVLIGLAVLPILVVTGVADDLPISGRIREGLRATQSLSYFVFILAAFTAVIHVRNTMVIVAYEYADPNPWRSRHSMEVAAFFWAVSLGLLAIAIVNRVAPHNIHQTLYFDGDRLVWSGSISRRDPPISQLLAERSTSTLVLRDNSGGDVETAERAAASLAALGITSVVVEGTCASACAHLWALSSGRAIAGRSVLGLHPARTRRLESGSGRLIFDEGASNRVTQRLIDALTAAGGDPMALQELFLQSNGEMQWLSVADLRELGIRFAVIER